MSEATEMQSKWGNPRANQISASVSGYLKTTVPVPEVKIFGWVLRKASTQEVGEYCSFDTEKGQAVPDDMRGERKFLYRCELIRTLTLLGAEQSYMQVFLDGYSNLRVPSSIVTLNIGVAGSDKLDAPLADVLFKGSGKRYGSLTQYEILRVTLWFKDRAQFNQYVAAVVVPAPAPKPAVHHHHTTVDRSDDNILPALVIGGLIGLALSD